MVAQFNLDTRSAGILLHPTSLPGPHGCGDLGPAAYRFVDWLASAGLRWWQMLPIGPVGDDGAPYSSYSAFAGGFHLISLDALVADGLLTPADIRSSPPRLQSDKVNWPLTLRFREEALRLAFAAFDCDRAGAKLHREFERYCNSQTRLADFARFCALRQQFDGRPWTAWPDAIKSRQATAMRQACAQVADEIRFQSFVQFIFDRQWKALQTYAVERGVGLLGDIPIFVSLDSSDVWANPELFQLDRDGRPKFMSGCPPDIFSKTGQLWGHPLYFWKEHQRTGFKWWIERFRRTLSQFQAARIDHFLGFNRCWAVPGRDKTALRGKWQPTPGRVLFSALEKALKNPQIIAEDLGFVTPEAAALRDDFGFPGMRILQNGFWDGARYDQPHNYPRNCVVYTGTHDNDTTAGWWKNVAKNRKRGKDGLTTRERALRYLDCKPGEVTRRMVRAALASRANTTIVPMQDVLGLDNRARMNVPATTEGNWSWRMKPDDLRPGDAKWLRGMVAAYQRCE